MKYSLFCIVLLGFVACTSAQFFANAIIRGTALNPNATGTVTFNQTDVNSNVTVHVVVTGLNNPGVLHGIHVHQYGDVSDEAASASTGTHFNPFNNPHACPENGAVRHLGDMGNWQVDADGNVDQVKTLDLLVLGGLNSIIGRAVVVHMLTDDCVNISSSAGRLAHGVIGVQNVSGAGLVNQASNGAANVTNAIAVLKPISGTQTAGTVWLSQPDPNGPTTVYAQITGIVGNHGFHIHQFGDLSSLTGINTGSHWNPDSFTHGIPNYTPRHAGDLGIIYYYNNTVAYYQYTNNYLTLNGPQSVIGRAIHVHNATDDCTNPVGGAGARIAQGAVGITNQLPPVFVGVPTTQDPTPCAIAYSLNSASGSATQSAATHASNQTQSATAFTTSSTINGDNILTFNMILFVDKIGLFLL